MSIFRGRRGRRPNYLLARPNADGTISEAAFMGRVIDALKLRGYETYHTLDSRGSEPGFPDVVGARKEPTVRLLFIETKSEKGRVRPEQKVWIDILWAVEALAGSPDGKPLVEAMVLRPQDDFEAFLEHIA